MRAKEKCKAKQRVIVKQIEVLDEYRKKIINLEAELTKIKSSLPKYLLKFYMWQKKNGCLYTDAMPEYRMKLDIEEFIKS